MNSRLTLKAKILMAVTLPTQEELATLTREERAEIAAAYLATLEAGRQPLPLFKELGRLMALSTVEVTPLRVRPGQAPEVLLTQRPASDPWWGNQWHLPGTVILDDDLGEDKGVYGYDKVLARLYTGELGDAVTIGESRLFDAHLRRGVRGAEQTVFRWAEVSLNEGYDEPPIGRFFDATSVADNPPEGGLIIGHGDTINRAVAHHAAYNSLPPELRAAFS